jgi:hypothetical protein
MTDPWMEAWPIIDSIANKYFFHLHSIGGGVAGYFFLGLPPMPVFQQRMDQWFPSQNFVVKFIRNCVEMFFLVIVGPLITTILIQPENKASAVALGITWVALLTKTVSKVRE